MSSPTTSTRARWLAMVVVPVAHVALMAWAWSVICRGAVDGGWPAAVVLLGAAAIAATEFGVAWLFERPRHGKRSWWRVTAVGRTIAVATFVAVTALGAASIDPADYPSGQTMNPTPLRVFVPQFWSFVSWLLLPMAGRIAVVWLPVVALHAWLWPRYRILRWVFVVLLPIVGAAAVFQGFYRDRWLSTPSDAWLERQAGVEVIVPRAELLAAARMARLSANDFVGLFPRNLAEDGGGGLIAAYGHTLSRDAVDYRNTPYLFRVDLGDPPRVIVAPPTGRLRAIQRHPRGDLLFVCSWDLEYIEVLDLTTLQRHRRIEGPFVETVDYFEPMDALAPPGRDDLFIANDIAAAVVRVDRGDGRWLGTVDLRPYSPPGSGAWKLTWSEGSSGRADTPAEPVLYAATAFGDTVAVGLDPDTLEVVQVIQGRGWLSAMTLDPVTGRLVGQRMFGTDVVAIDPVTGATERLGRGLRGGRGVAVDPSGRLIAVTGWLHHRLVVLDTATGRRHRVRVGHKPNGVAIVDGQIYVLSVNGLVRIDPTIAWGIELWPRRVSWASLRGRR